MNKEKNDIDYRKIFLVGIIFIGVGITFSNTMENGAIGIALLAIGGLMMMSGASQKDTWGKK